MKAAAPALGILGALIRLAARLLGRNAERGAREALGMAARHPERLTAELPEGDEEWLAATAAELWPDDDYTAIIAETRGEGQQ